MTTPPVILAVLLIGLAAAGCSSTSAFLFKKNEFNRHDPNFNKPITDRDDVTICYNGIGTSDGHVARLAQDECSRLGKNAKADGESFGECPLSTPVAARFLCVGPQSSLVPTTNQVLPTSPETTTD